MEVRLKSPCARPSTSGTVSWRVPAMFSVSYAKLEAYPANFRWVFTIVSVVPAIPRASRLNYSGLRYPREEIHKACAS